jgi:ABC-2 type transport system ATP-binding protein
MSSTSWMIETRSLGKRFGETVAVDDLNLAIGPGEIFGFLGPNGAGKTTTIKMLVGLLRPSAGQALIAGYDVQQQPLQAKSLVGLVPDTPFLYERLTGKEFLRFVARIYSLNPRQAGQRADELLQMFDLADRAGDLVQGYSHGMRQKLALAAALLHEPRVFFLDEPTVGLDPKSARQVKDLLRNLAAHGTCVFMSTHILEIAERMCDRVGIIDRGRLIACGTMDELRQAGGPGTLEDVFLQLTGGAEVAELASHLEG